MNSRFKKCVKDYIKIRLSRLVTYVCVCVGGGYLKVVADQRIKKQRTLIKTDGGMLT